MADRLLTEMLRKAESIGPTPLPELKLGMMPLNPGGMLSRTIGTRSAPSLTDTMKDLLDLGVLKAVRAGKDELKQRYSAATNGHSLKQLPGDAIQWLVNHTPVSPDAPRVK